MNRLSDSSSLYLRQHADNPVEWHPWDEQALAAAKKADLPILLSIGYSACHWCHVMAHESFEDEATAQVMNRLYFNIKVDREERPDLDRVYQLSHQLLTGRGGGWPLTLLLDPSDLTPFFAGTYFPPEPRHGLPAFRDLLQKARQWFDEHRDEVTAQNERLSSTVAELQQPDTGQEPPESALLSGALEQLQASFDERHGGFGGAPKFPQAPLLALIRTLADLPDGSKPADMLHHTLTRMASSGLRDHLDGGFFRYTVDDDWTIPHFEKMLYDNAMLLPLYAEEAERRDDDFLAAAATGIVDWLYAFMRAENGAFYASMDADADGVEGAFHIWTPSQMRDCLDADEFTRATAFFGLDGPPNFEGKYWHLLRQAGPDEAALPKPLLDKLRRARSMRTPPGTDTKHLTAWNALCIEGLVRAGRALGRQDWIDLAEQATKFLQAKVWKDGVLYAVYAQDEAQYPAYLDDHAYLISALLELLQARGRRHYLDFAIELADTLLERFADPEHGGFWFSSSAETVPIHRMRTMQDDATPSGNGIAARALLRLGQLCGDTRYLDAAQRTLAAAASGMRRHPLAHASLLTALQRFKHPKPHIIIRGKNLSAIETLSRAVPHRLQVNCYAFETGFGEIGGLPVAGDGSGVATAWVCSGTHCLPPVHSAEQLADLLETVN